MNERIGQYGKYRFWEILPATLIWSTLILSVITSFLAPTIAIIFIIVFDLYWTLRVIYFIIHIIFAYKTYRQNLKVDWMKELKTIEGADEIVHLVMLPTYKEGVTILRAALKSIVASTYANDKFIIVLGGEEGDEKNFTSHAKKLEKEFGDKFRKFIVTLHPRGLPGEIPGKGSNLSWMAGKVRTYIDKEKIPYDKIIVSAFDIDTSPHPQYFALLAKTVLTEEDPLRSSYQPVVVFSNNIWKAKVPVRVESFGTTFWLFGELVRPERLWTFSSHSMPWQMLVDVGYWEKDMVSEDSRIFLQGLLHYEGDYRVTPIFLPVSMDAVEGDNYLDTMKALYKQKRRWAWGVEHLPYMIGEFRKHPKMPKRVKAQFLFNHIEGMYTWATAPILIFVLGYLPFFIAHDVPTAIIANSPFTLEWMMRIATLGIFATGFLGLTLLPPRPGEVKPWHWIVMIFQWALLPFTFLIFGAIPAIDAQTRLALGKYLGFDVTKKKG
jgi:hypothetical protein